jgi:hypothetical protein
LRRGAYDPGLAGEGRAAQRQRQRPNKNSFTVDGVSVNSGVAGSAAPAQFSGGALPAMTSFGACKTRGARPSTRPASKRRRSRRGRPHAMRSACGLGSNDWHGWSRTASGTRSWPPTIVATSRGYERAPLRLNQ